MLKKLGLELINKNYRPVSNLSFLSKLIEKALQLVDHLLNNGLMDKFQSAYTDGHSTKTALLRVQNDILMELDKGKVVMLVLLDLSAALDTIDHEILLKDCQDNVVSIEQCLSGFNHIWKRELKL